MKSMDLWKKNYVSIDDEFSCQKKKMWYLLHEDVGNDGDTEEEVAQPEEVDNTHECVVHQGGSRNKNRTKK